MHFMRLQSCSEAAQSLTASSGAAPPCKGCGCSCPPLHNTAVRQRSPWEYRNVIKMLLHLAKDNLNLSPQPSWQVFASLLGKRIIILKYGPLLFFFFPFSFQYWELKASYKLDKGSTSELCPLHSSDLTFETGAC